MPQPRRADQPGREGGRAQAVEERARYDRLFWRGMSPKSASYVLVEHGEGLAVRIVPARLRLPRDLPARLRVLRRRRGVCQKFGRIAAGARKMDDALLRLRAPHDGARCTTTAPEKAKQHGGVLGLRRCRRSAWSSHGGSGCRRTVHSQGNRRASATTRGPLYSALIHHVRFRV